jgi:DNA-binding NarL/FixJ family response regulator
MMAASSSKSPRVLLVDDHPETRALVRQMLAADGLDVVGEVGDGKAALAFVADTDVDIVIMDVRMPIMGGIEATRAIKTTNPEVQVIIFSIVDTDEEEAAALAAGAYAYLVKGASFVSLPAQLLEAWGRETKATG